MMAKKVDKHIFLVVAVVVIALSLTAVAILNQNGINLTGFATYGAQCVSNTLPATMTSGQAMQVSVTMKNLGRYNWEWGTYYKYGLVPDSSNSQNSLWSVTQAQIPTGVKIPPGSQYTFSFNIKAPTTPGTYSSRFKMNRNGVQFGANCGRDIIVQAACNNDCSPYGTKQCISSTQYKTCSNYDSDTCLEWGSDSSCALGQTCQGGNCVTSSETEIKMIRFCQYSVSNGNMMTTTHCDPKAQLMLKQQGWTYLWHLAYAYTPDPQPKDTTEICIYNHPSKGKYTTTECSGFAKMALQQQGYIYIEKLGYILPADAIPRFGFTELCRWDKQGKHLTTTVCSGELAAKMHDIYGWTYIKKLGYIYFGGITPPIVELGELKIGNKVIAKASKSLEKERLLYAPRNGNIPSELPILPFILDGSLNYILSGSSSIRCPSNDNFLDKYLTFSGCTLLTMPGIAGDYNMATGIWWDTVKYTEEHWKQSYHGITRLYVAGSGEARKIIGITHGENQNYMEQGMFLPNTIKAETPNVSCYSSSTNNWWHCWSSFSSFANMVWWNNSQFAAKSFPVEEGPVAWPSSRYSESFGAGPYTPTSLLEGNNLYIYYKIRAKNRVSCFGGVRAVLGQDNLPIKYERFLGNK